MIWGAAPSAVMPALCCRGLVHSEGAAVAALPERACGASGQSTGGLAQAAGVPLELPGGAVRPVVNPALRRLWRATESLQLGLDPDHAQVLEGIGPRQSRFLALLDGTRDADGVLREARTHGMSEAEVRRLLELLSDAGVLIDASLDSMPLARLPLSDRDRLAPDLAAWSLLSSEPSPGARLARRKASSVLVDDGRVGELVAALLSDAGVGRVLRSQDPRQRASSARPHPADLVVLTPAGPAVRTVRTGRLLASGTPHLVVSCYESVAAVGPLVVPGAGPCLGCLDLHRGDRDPGWPLVAAQLATRPPAGSPAPGSVACDLALATAASALGALAALAVLDGPVARPARAGVAAGTSVDDHPLLGAQWLLRLPFCLPRRRTWGVHPACGCGWPGHVASREPA